jgi:Ca2+-binding EF-hand superfamily protein
MKSTNYSRRELYTVYSRYSALVSLPSNTARGRGIDKPTLWKGMSRLAVEDKIFVDRVFGAIDHDGDGVIQWPEFVVFMTALEKGSMEAKVRFFFPVYDLDDDGLLSRADIKTMVKSSTQLGDDWVSDEVVDSFVDKLFGKFGHRPDSKGLALNEVLEYMRHDTEHEDVWELFGRAMIDDLSYDANDVGDDPINASKPALDTSAIYDEDFDIDKECEKFKDYTRTGGAPIVRQVLPDGSLIKMRPKIIQEERVAGEIVVSTFDADEAKFEALCKDTASANKQWVRLDSDHSGHVTIYEVGKWLERDFPRLNNHKALRRAFTQTTIIEGDGNPTVEYSEFRTLLSNLLYFNRLYAVFSKMDKDGDSCVSLDEFKRAVRSTKADIGDRQLLAEFSEIDANGGGSITFEEMVSWIAKKGLTVRGLRKDEALDASLHVDKFKKMAGAVNLETDSASDRLIAKLRNKESDSMAAQGSVAHMRVKVQQAVVAPGAVYVPDEHGLPPEEEEKEEGEGVGGAARSTGVGAFGSHDMDEPCEEAKAVPAVLQPAVLKRTNSVLPTHAPNFHEEKARGATPLRRTSSLPLTKALRLPLNLDSGAKGDATLPSPPPSPPPLPLPPPSSSSSDDREMVDAAAPSETEAPSLDTAQAVATPPTATSPPSVE